MILVLEAALPARAADESSARAEDRTTGASETWDQAAWGALPAGAVVLVRDPGVQARLYAERGAGELRADLALVPLFDLGGEARSASSRAIRSSRADLGGTRRSSAPRGSGRCRRSRRSARSSRPTTRRGNGPSHVTSSPPASLPGSSLSREEGASVGARWRNCPRRRSRPPGVP